MKMIDKINEKIGNIYVQIGKHEKEKEKSIKEIRDILNERSNEELSGRDIELIKYFSVEANISRIEIENLNSELKSLQEIKKCKDV